MLFHVFALTLSGFAFLTTIVAECYLPDGTERNEDGNVSGWYLPCNITQPGGSHSMCCRLGGGGPLDTCLDSGLCYNEGNSQVYWRESCTDPTWQDPSCIKLLVNGTDSSGNQYSHSDVQITECEDGSWCPFSGNNLCCRQHQGYQVHDGSVLPASLFSSTTSSSSSHGSTTTSSSSSSRGPTTTSSFTSTHLPLTTVTPSPQPQAASSSTSSTNIGAIVGGAVGGVVGLFLIIAIISVIWIRHNKKKASRSDTTESQAGFQTAPVKPGPGPGHNAAISGYYAPMYKSNVATGGTGAHEMSTYNRVHELDGTNRAELDVH